MSLVMSFLHLSIFNTNTHFTHNCLVIELLFLSKPTFEKYLHLNQRIQEVSLKPGLCVDHEITTQGIQCRESIAEEYWQQQWLVACSVESMLNATLRPTVSTLLSESPRERFQAGLVLVQLFSIRTLPCHFPQEAQWWHYIVCKHWI